MTRTKARQCDGKYKHASRNDAVAHLLALARESGAAKSSLQAYRCRHCKGYHVGHKERRRGPV